MQDGIAARLQAQLSRQLAGDDRPFRTGVDQETIWPPPRNGDGNGHPQTAIRIDFDIVRGGSAVDGLGRADFAVQQRGLGNQGRGGKQHGRNEARRKFHHGRSIEHGPDIRSEATPDRVVPQAQRPTSEYPSTSW